MSFFTHLAATTAIVYCIASYLTCGYVIFFPKEDLKDINLSIRFIFWLISPLVTLDVLYEKIFGRSMLS